MGLPEEIKLDDFFFNFEDYTSDGIFLSHHSVLITADTEKGKPKIFVFQGEDDCEDSYFAVFYELQNYFGYIEEFYNLSIIEKMNLERKYETFITKNNLC